MRSLGLAIAFCALLVLAAAAEAGAEGTAVVGPGQDELLADMLGRGAALPGPCAFTGGQIDGAAIRGIYQCPGGEVVFELRHPSAAPGAPVKTDRFAITVLNGSPPPELTGALESRVRSREGGFEWTQIAPTPTPLPPQPPLSSGSSAPMTALLAAAGLLAIATLWWLAPVLRRSAARLLPLLRDKWFWAVLAIFVVSAAARAWLGVVNWHSNDDHSIVAHMIREAGWQPPASSACMECSHPKLYHYTLAAALALTPYLPSLETLNPRSSLLVGNLLNWGALTALLALCIAFARRSRWSTPVRVLALAFISFNAGLVGIFSQTTNDGFCILFSALAVYCLSRFFADLSMKEIIAATLCMILAALSKASGWAIFAASAGVLVVKLVSAVPGRRGKYAAATAVFVLGFLAVVSSVNPYRDNIARAGTPFVNDAFDLPLMRLEVTREPDWVVQDYFTFRYLELLRVPYNTYGPGPYPLHRGSLWSQLYGRMFFLRFDQNIWQNTDPRLLALGRLCLILGSLPLAALLVGTAERVDSVWRGVARRGLRWFAEDGEWHHLVYVAVMLASLIALLVEYHRLAIMSMWMKAFYLFPAILSFFSLFGGGLELLWRRHPRLVTWWMLAVVVASIADLGWLIRDLATGAWP